MIHRENFIKFFRPSLFISALLSLYACQSTPLIYSNTEAWSGFDGQGSESVSGEMRSQISLTREPKGYRLRIEKDMTPFSQKVDFETEAHESDGRFTFQGTDNWGNAIFGYFKIEDDKCLFYMDCSTFSENGKNLARFYGDTEVLYPGMITWE